MKCRNIASVTSKSAMTPSLSGRTATMFAGVRPSMRFASSPTVRICTHHAQSRTQPPIMHIAEEMPQQSVGNVEVLADAILNRTHRDNVSGRTTVHALRFVTYCQHPVSSGLYGHHRRLTQN